jgi:predicted RNase H-like nuclease (RuvC/YqgF family)
LEDNADKLPNPDAPFDTDESNEWRKRLDGIVERMEKLEGENKIHKGKLQELKREIEELKGKLRVLPKRTWVRAAGNKILDFIESAAKEGMKTLAEVTVKGFLTGGK